MKELLTERPISPFPPLSSSATGTSSMSSSSMLPTADNTAPVSFPCETMTADCVVVVDNARPHKEKFSELPRRVRVTFQLPPEYDNHDLLDNSSERSPRRLKKGILKKKKGGGGRRRKASSHSPPRVSARKSSPPPPAGVGSNRGAGSSRWLSMNDSGDSQSHKNGSIGSAKAFKAPAPPSIPQRQQSIEIGSAAKFKQQQQELQERQDEALLLASLASEQDNSSRLSMRSTSEQEHQQRRQLVRDEPPLMQQQHEQPVAQVDMPMFLPERQSTDPSAMLLDSTSSTVSSSAQQVDLPLSRPERQNTDPSAMFWFDSTSGTTTTTTSVHTHTDVPLSLPERQTSDPLSNFNSTTKLPMPEIVRRSTSDTNQNNNNDMKKKEAAVPLSGFGTVIKRSKGSLLDDDEDSDEEEDATETEGEAQNRHLMMQALQGF